MEEISREYYLAHSGHKPTAELQPIYARHAAVLGPEALEATLEAFRAAKAGTEDHRSARLLVDWQAESQSARQLAELDEREIAWQGSAVVNVTDTRQIKFEATSIEIANNPDADDRHTIEAARAKLVGRELAPIKRERFQRERDITESLGLAPSYNATFELLSGLSLTDLAAQCAQFLEDTDALWDEVLPEFVKRVLGMNVRDVTRADALALMRAREFDRYFPAARMEEAITGQVREMGVDPLAVGRISLDTGEREGKRSRAFCSPVRVPAEVYLVLRPHGGQSDYNTFLHELGHALHFAYADADFPFEFRWLGDNSVTESYVMLFDHRMQDKGWLLRYTELGSNRVAAFLRTAGFEELHFLRRYCAKFLYERSLYGGEVPWDELPDLYVSLLSKATGFEYDPADAFVDVDPRFYSARYLRAWQLQSVLNEELTSRFDIDWFRNPSAGPWMVTELFSSGQRNTAEEIAEQVSSSAREPKRQSVDYGVRGGGKSVDAGALSFDPLTRKVEALLEA